MNGARYDIPLPDVHEDYSHLPEFLGDVGPTHATGFGHAPVPFSEIGAWSRETGLDLTSFEVQALHDMSAHYASVANRPDAECPTALGDDTRAAIDEAAFATWDALFAEDEHA